ncbi:unnamed protein product [Aphanomyces euteiches]
MKLRAYETRRTKLRERRRKQSITSNQHVLIRVYRSILQNLSSPGRVIGVLGLGRFLSLSCEEQNARARKAYRQARDAYHDNQTPVNSMMLSRALDEWDKQSVQLEHLCRELAQLCVVDPTTYSGLAMLAAQHLLDGFSLELMDGDAGVVNLVWVTGVLNALKLQVLVLSILGVQSSGKSTLLNYMFGVRLHTSVSRCTRGVNIQLLKCDGRREYEYIILLDTEGILDDEIQSTLSEECYSKWATDQQSHKDDQEAHWRKLVHGQVDNVFRYDTFVAQYKMELRSEANALFGNGRYKHFNEEQITRKFDDIFQRILHYAYDEHPPLHREVPSMVEKVFCATKIRVLSRQDAKKTWSSSRDSEKRETKRTWWNYFFGVKEQPMEKLEATILNSVQDILGTVTQYDDATVLKCIGLTQSMLVDAIDEGKMILTDDYQKRVYYNVKRKICHELQTIQSKCDQKNGVGARFAASRDEMKTYFDNLGKGFQGMRLLQSIVCAWLERNVHQSFLEELVVAVGVVLKDKRWVSDAEVMQAMVDNSLVMLIENNRVDRAIHLIKHPSGHIDDILSELIQFEVHRCYEEKFQQFTKRLIQCIQTSAAKAYEAEKDRSSGLLDQLPTAATNCLLTTIPHTNDGNINCDDQPAEIFDKKDEEFVCWPMIETIEQLSARHRQVDDVSKDVLTFIRSRAHGAASGATPRCGEPCPICMSPCTRELGHVTTEDEKCHDTYHQPTGLTGWKDKLSRELSPGSCVANAEADISFQYTDGEFHPYKNFHKVFPNWSQPIKKQPLLLREYMFRNFQDNLVAMYDGTKICTDIPAEYNHSLQDIKQTISTLIS